MIPPTEVNKKLTDSSAFEIDVEVGLGEERYRKAKSMYMWYST